MLLIASLYPESLERDVGLGALKEYFCDSSAFGFSAAKTLFERS